MNCNWKKIPLKNLNYVVFDIETNGLNKETDFIIELTAWKINNCQVISKFHTFIQPENFVKFVDLYGIKRRAKCAKCGKMFFKKPTEYFCMFVKGDLLTLKQAPKFIQAYNLFVDFVSDSILVGHNIKTFDLPFLNYWANKTLCNSNILNKDFVIDTRYVSKWVYKQTVNKLPNFCAYSGVCYSQQLAHRSDYDVEVTSQAWINTINFLANKQIYTWDQLEKFKSSKI